MIVPFTHRDQAICVPSEERPKQLPIGTVMIDLVSGEHVASTQLTFCTTKDRFSNGDRKKPSIYWRLVPYVEIWFENDVPVRVFVNDCEIHNFVLWVKHAIPS